MFGSLMSFGIGHVKSPHISSWQVSLGPIVSIWRKLLKVLSVAGFHYSSMSNHLDRPSHSIRRSLEYRRRQVVDRARQGRCLRTRQVQPDWNGIEQVQGASTA